MGFNVTVDHDMRVLHVCSMFAGRFNDKTKVLYDTYVKRLREGFYDGFSFNLRDSEGVETTHHDNPYLTCDGGYHKWLQLMCGFKTTNVEALALWSKKLESIRKDVECAFGVMKKRFKVLKIPLLFRDVSFMENIFMTCCCLHNMLLDHDAQFRSAPFRVGGVEYAQTKRRILVNNVSRLLRKHDDYSCTEQGGLDTEKITQVDDRFTLMRKRLADHAYHVFRHS